MDSVFTGDIYGDHDVSCVDIIGIKHRHNVVRDTLVDICFQSGISAGKEVDIGLGGGRDKALRPADILLYSWDGGLDVCVDLTGSSLLTQTRMADFVPGRAVTGAAQCKRVKYEAKCADIGYGFLPFSFSSFRELEKDAMTLLKRIRKFSMAQDIGARAAVHIFNRISFSIAKGVGAQIVSRLPSNLLYRIFVEYLIRLASFLLGFQYYFFRAFLGFLLVTLHVLISAIISSQRCHFNSALWWLDMVVVRFHCPFVGLSGCHDDSGKGLTKTSLITHLHDHHCNGDV
ncbi:hypothetical protein Tco_0916156 [Tanacetum coccineum]